MATLFCVREIEIDQSHGTVCDPAHSTLCLACGIDPSDQEAGAIAIDGLDAAILVGVHPEDGTWDHATAGDWYWVSDRTDGTGYIVSAGYGSLETDGRDRLLDLRVY